MQLTGSTDLALRLVMRLAVLDEEQSVTTASLAEELHVSAGHAAKVVTTLARLGVVETRRGRAGGIRLAVPAGAISVGALLRRLSGGREVVACEGPDPCPLRGGCRLRAALADAQEAFYAALDPLTVADLTAAPTGPLLLTLGPAVRA